MSTDFLPGKTRSLADGATLVCIFVAVLMLVPARLVFKGIPLSLTPGNVAALFAGICWVCAQLTLTLGMAKGRTPVRTGLFVYMIAVVMSYGYANYGPLPADEVKLSDHAIVLVAGNCAVALMMNDGVRGLIRLDKVLKTGVVCGAGVALVGCCQFLLKLDLTKYMVLPGLRATSDDSAVQTRDALARVAGTTGHPIEFGVLCAMLLPLAAHFAFQAKQRGEPALRWWICCGIIAAGMMFSVSRSAVLSILGAAVVLFLGWPAKRRWYTLLVGAVFLGVIKVAVPSLLGALVDLFANIGNDSSISHRTYASAVAAKQISLHPLFGHGPGTWYAGKHEVFDNQYILSTVETGFVGVAAFASIFLCAFYSALRARYLSKDPGARDLALTICACLVAPLIGSATFDLLGFATVTGFTFVLVGAAGSLLRTAKQLAPHEDQFGVLYWVRYRWAWLRGLVLRRRRAEAMPEPVG
ncbi:O-antigen ligase family protein [Kutzneria sp. CA-103260]|uniref:O-antigen ligase family protein n=1 Tax=Kutzneria sp. CA-103260 TaxID=2802641 RepID=UPI001BAE2F80|nr:O-antigen ligase family protein [Kutzneria sp. CA-103260]QUQ68420.1 O-antigen polymerase [Kutzneria sp. CA-103260]